MEHWVEVAFDGCGVAIITWLLERYVPKHSPSTTTTPYGRRRRWAIAVICGAIAATSIALFIVKRKAIVPANAPTQNAPDQPVIEKSSPTRSGSRPARAADGISNETKPIPQTSNAAPLLSGAGLKARGPATVADRLTHILVEQLQIDGKSIRPDADIETNLGGGPLDKQEIVMQLEMEYNIQIPDAEVTKLHTVGDFIAYIQKRIGSQ